MFLIIQYVTYQNLQHFEGRELSIFVPHSLSLSFPSFTFPPKDFTRNLQDDCLVLYSDPCVLKIVINKQKAGKTYFLS